MIVPLVILIAGVVFLLVRLADIYVPPFVTWLLLAVMDGFDQDERRSLPPERRPRFGRGCASLPRIPRRPMQAHSGIDAHPHPAPSGSVVHPGPAGMPSPVPGEGSGRGARKEEACRLDPPG